jgi:RES domain-containing protein
LPTEAPSLLELERFSHGSLQKWLRAADNLGRLQAALYFGLESSRQEHGQALIDALRASACIEFEFRDWSRIVDYRYTLEPLSIAGSVKGEGGRFNIGARLSPGAFTPFPALYVAEDYSTAYCERFGQLTDARKVDLTGAELALRRPGSFTQVRLQGRLDLVLDVGDPAALKPFVDIIKQFALPKTVGPLSHKLRLRRPPGMVRTVAGLQRQLFQANWRILPMQFDLPANSQVFGRVASAAGLHGILYPSARQEGKQCLVLFPQNWRGSSCFVEVADRVPPGARLVRLDATTGAVE